VFSLGLQPAQKSCGEGPGQCFVRLRTPHTHTA
jgi:hypothetical protein